MLSDDVFVAITASCACAATARSSETLSARSSGTDSITRSQSASGSPVIAIRPLTSSFAPSGTSSSLSATSSPSCTRLAVAAALPATMERNLVVEVDGTASVVRDDRDDVADLGFPVAAGEVEGAVLFGQVPQERVRVLDDEPVHSVVEAGREVGAEGL